uniref:Uncharacterized protein n=1 Tax=Ditylenchus dipsaci TaxID=166011 RepID=A0A915CWB6_9BILA
MNRQTSTAIEIEEDGDSDEDFAIIDAEECVPSKVTQRKDNDKGVVENTKLQGHQHVDHYGGTKESANTQQQVDKENILRCYSDRLLAIRQSVLDNTTELSMHEKTELTKKCCQLLSSSFDTQTKLHSHYEVCVAEAERLLALNDTLVAANKIDKFVHENTIQTDTLLLAKKVYGLKKEFSESIGDRRRSFVKAPPITQQELAQMFEAFVDGVQRVIPAGHPLHVNNKLNALFELSFVELNKEQQ